MEICSGGTVGAQGKSLAMLPSVQRLFIKESMRTSEQADCHGRICFCQKQRKKHYDKRDRRGTIQNRLSIEYRPAIIETRSRIGDWEADTVIGKNHRQAIVSTVERMTIFTLINKVVRKIAHAVSQTMVGLLKSYQNKAHTMTSDNGRKFAGHEEIAKRLKAEFYFAHPCSSWKPGINENTNGLIRQYFPKNRGFTTITRQEIDAAMERPNNRPRTTWIQDTQSGILQVRRCTSYLNPQNDAR